MADAMHEEYKAITDAGLYLQIDDPDLPDGWQMSRDERARLSALCRGARRGDQSRAARHSRGTGAAAQLLGQRSRSAQERHRPGRHHRLGVESEGDTISIEAANPRHEHEWRVWKTSSCPRAKCSCRAWSAMPPTSSSIRDRSPIAWCCTRVVGQENVIAGTDCGLGPRVGDPSDRSGRSSSNGSRARVWPPRNCGQNSLPWLSIPSKISLQQGEDHPYRRSLNYPPISLGGFLCSFRQCSACGETIGSEAHSNCPDPSPSAPILRARCSTRLPAAWAK